MNTGIDAVSFKSAFERPRNIRQRFGLNKSVRYIIVSDLTNLLMIIDIHVTHYS